MTAFHRDREHLDIARIIHQHCSNQRVPCMEILEEYSPGQWKISARDTDGAGFTALHIVVEQFAGEDGVAALKTGRKFKIFTNSRLVDRPGHCREEFLAREDYRPEGKGYNRPYLVVERKGELTVQDSCNNSFRVTEAELAGLPFTEEQLAFIQDLFL